MKHELVLKSGTIVDGSGAPAFVADLAIDDGVITAIGPDLAGEREVDASGAIVAPGWIDVHTHFDGQATWDDELDPSFSNGVTTLVMGNCGVGFAPCPPGGQDVLVDLMEGVEDIPGTALHEGVPWGEWSTFPEYLDFLAARSYTMDIAAQVPHAALRFAVMGERGLANDDATDADIAQMRQLVAEATQAGAVGFTTSRTIFHRSISGVPVPGTYATREELSELVQGMADGGGGVFEAITSESIGNMRIYGGERFSEDEELALLSDISKATGQPVTFTTLQHGDAPDAWRAALAFAREMNETGAHLYPQVASRPAGFLSGLAGYHPFSRRRTYLEIADLPVHERAAAMRDPEIRAAILSDSDVEVEQAGSMENLYKLLRSAIGRSFPLDDIVDYEPSPEQSFAALAAERGVTLEEAMYDFLAAGDGTNIAALPGVGYVKGDMEDLREMLVDPGTIVGLGDAGAHVKLICDGSVPTTQLTHWVRDRTRGERIPLEFMVHKQTLRNAQLYGFADRGELAVGKRADVNVIDFKNLNVHRPVAHADLPAGGLRYLQPVEGYVATFVGGVQTRANDTDTGERPGRLLRSHATSSAAQR